MSGSGVRSDSARASGNAAGKGRVWLRRLGVWAVVTILDAGLLVGGLALYAFVWEPNHVVLERVSLEREARNGRTGSLRIAQVSDLDLRRPPGYRERCARALIEQAKPDLVAFSGDIIGDVSREEGLALLRSGVDWLASLPSTQGTFIVLGEEETPLRAQLEAMLPPNVHFIQDDWQRLQTGGLETIICGPNGHPPELRPADNSFGKALLVGEGASRRRVIYRGRAPGGGARPAGGAGEAGGATGVGGAADAGAAPGEAGDEGDPRLWHDYELSGRLLMTRPGDAFGLVLYAGGTEAAASGYEFSKMQGESGFKLRSESEKLTGDHKGATGIVEVDTWHRFRLQIQTGEVATRLRSKFWREDEPEPNTWQGEMEDRSPERARAGTIAIVTGGWECGREKYIDDLQVRTRESGQADLIFEDDFTDPARFRAEWEGSGPAYARADLVVMVAHSPDVVRGLHYARAVDLILVGHTHGGQAVLPLFGPVESNMIVDPKLYTGTHELGGVTLHVNRGIGTAVIPARVACPPEVTLIELRVVDARSPSPGPER